jgi:hypothetical protein
LKFRTYGPPALARLRCLTLAVLTGTLNDPTSATETAEPF